MMSFSVVAQHLACLLLKKSDSDGGRPEQRSFLDTHQCHAVSEVLESELLAGMLFKAEFLHQNGMRSLGNSNLKVFGPERMEHVMGAGLPSVLTVML